jgi:hypothetical protein
MYRLAAIASEHSLANVSIDDHDETITVHVGVEGEPPDLTEVRDRTSTLNGQLTISSGETNTRITHDLPTGPGVSSPDRSGRQAHIDAHRLRCGKPPPANPAAQNDGCRPA